eukprot:751231-Hanusia_phi.AAC.3
MQHLAHPDEESSLFLSSSPLLADVFFSPLIPSIYPCLCISSLLFSSLLISSHLFSSHLISSLLISSHLISSHLISSPSVRLSSSPFFSPLHG